jgi:hypothetical protein
VTLLRSIAQQLRRLRYDSRPGEGAGELGEDGQVGVQPDALQAVRWRACQPWALSSLVVEFPELRIPRSY